MTARGIAKGVTVVVGLVVLSPAQALALRLGSGSGLLFVFFPVVDILAIAAVAWGVRSASVTALLGTLAASPWFLYFKPEAGEWAYLFAGPELLMLATLGWYAWRKESRTRLRWLGALVPTLAVAWGMLAPLIRK